jgi:hypothetical protein
MALDFTILDSEHNPIKQVPIGLVAHQRIIELASHLPDSQLIARMHDYYEDVNYTASEIPLLIEEIKTIRKLVDNDDDISNLLSKLEQLCHEALTKQLFVAAIAD